MGPLFGFGDMAGTRPDLDYMEPLLSGVATISAIRHMPHKFGYGLEHASCKFWARQKLGFGKISAASVILQP